METIYEGRNAKVIFAVFFLFICIIGVYKHYHPKTESLNYSSASVTTAPSYTHSPAMPKAVPITKTSKGTYIYSGIPENYRYYDDALLRGIIKPLGGSGTIDQLYEGDQNSDFIMVYQFIRQAYMAATLNETKPGLLGVKKDDLSGNEYARKEDLKNGDIYFENPIFIKYSSTGWVFCKVVPGMPIEAVESLVKTLL